jgi:hypothetical protein
MKKLIASATVAFVIAAAGTLPSFVFGDGAPAASAATGYPDASDTGVPPGTVLTTVGGFSTTSDGQVISGLKVTGTITVRNSGVTIKDTEIDTDGNFGIRIITGKNLTVEDTTIHGTSAGSGRLSYGVFDGAGDATTLGIQLLRLNIYWCRIGDQLTQGLIKDSYYHDEGFITGDHNEPSGSWGGSIGLKDYEHDTMLNQLAQTAAIYLTAYYGNIGPVTVNDSLLAGGGYAIYGGDRNGGGKATGIRITGNEFSTRYYPQGGFWGPDAYFTPSNPGNTWSGNTWADGPHAGQLIAP